MLKQLWSVMVYLQKQTESAAIDMRDRTIETTVPPLDSLMGTPKFRDHVIAMLDVNIFGKTLDLTSI
jgi:hypothetical protein